MCKPEKQSTEEQDTSQHKRIKKFAYNLLEVLIRHERGDEYCSKLLSDVGAVKVDKR